MKIVFVVYVGRFYDVIVWRRKQETLSSYVRLGVWIRSSQLETLVGLPLVFFQKLKY